MLTRKQHELLLFIHERLKESGIPPSFDEMKDALDLASKSGIHRLITALEERGFIRRLAQPCARAGSAASAGLIAPGLNAQRKFSPSVIEGSLGRNVGPRRPQARSSDDERVDGRQHPGHGPHRGRCADRRHPAPDPYDLACRRT